MPGRVSDVLTSIQADMMIAPSASQLSIVHEEDEPSTSRHIVAVNVSPQEQKDALQHNQAATSSGTTKQVLMLVSTFALQIAMGAIADHSSVPFALQLVVVALGGAWFISGYCQRERYRSLVTSAAYVTGQALWSASSALEPDELRCVTTLAVGMLCACMLSGQLPRKVMITAHLLSCTTFILLRLTCSANTWSLSTLHVVLLYAMTSSSVIWWSLASAARDVENRRTTHHSAHGANALDLVTPFDQAMRLLQDFNQDGELSHDHNARLQRALNFLNASAVGQMSRHKIDQITARQTASGIGANSDAFGLWSQRNGPRHPYQSIRNKQQNVVGEEVYDPTNLARLDADTLKWLSGLMRDDEFQIAYEDEDEDASLASIATDEDADMSSSTKSPLTSVALERHGTMHRALRTSISGVQASINSSEEMTIFALSEQLNNWDFDVFDVVSLTNNRPLFFIGLLLFRKHNLITRFRIDKVTLCNFLNNIEAGYKNELPYHNCLSGDSVITLANGFSRPIADVVAGTLVLSHTLTPDVKTSGHIVRTSSALFAQGSKSCVELLFSDGRTITCTPDHRFLTPSGAWVEAGDMLIGTTEIVAGMEHPLLDNPRSRHDHSWHLNVPSLPIEYLDAQEHLEHSIAFSGLLGYLLTDGTINEMGGAQLFVGHHPDIAWMQRDIELLTGTKPDVSRQASCWSIRLPVALYQAMLHIGVSTADRLSTVTRFPSFLMQESCPTAVVQAFLGGLFGGDGKAPSLIWFRQRVTRIAEVRFSLIRKGHVQAEQSAFTSRELKALLTRCGLSETLMCKASITEAGRNEIFKRKLSSTSVDPNASYSIVWSLTASSTLEFARGVGFRYCCHKQMRLTAACTYYRIKRLLATQKQFITDAILTKEAVLGRNLCGGANNSELLQCIRSAKQALARCENVHPDIAEWTPAENKRSRALDGSHLLDMRLDQLLRSFNVLRFFSDERTKPKYDAESDKVRYAMDIDAEALPCFQVKLIGRRITGPVETFDITVPPTENFLANGIATHNSTHAADVARSMHFFIQRIEATSDVLQPLDVMVALVACIVHDFQHPGLSNAYLAKTRHDLALNYNDCSILENMHVSSSYRLMQRPENNIWLKLKPKQAEQARQMLIDLVLSTDLANHFEFVNQFKNTMTGDAAQMLNLTSEGSRLTLLKMALKCSDIAHAAKNRALHIKWSLRITEEFYRQGDLERERGITVSPFMDRTAANMSKSQQGFIDYLATPLFRLWTDFLQLPEDNMPCMRELERNRAYWVEQETATTLAV